MNLLTAAAAFLLAVLFALIGVTRVSAWMVERRNPPVGSFMQVGGVRLHYVHVPAPAGKADLPPVVFIHGASANLKDQMIPLQPLLEGRAELLFVDRPGLGWSERGPEARDTQSEQADLIAGLMDRLGMGSAIVVAHSFGSSIALQFALSHPEKTRGLVFLSAATHPWPGGATSWYYDLTAIPVVGRLFVETLAVPGGLMRIAGATECVFAPNKVPDDYLARASIDLVLRPSAFRNNAIDVEALYRYATANQPRYREIKAPTVVISGDYDTVVYEEIHSPGLVRDIPGAELVWVKNLGHKPDWIAPDLVVAAIEKVAGLPRDVQAVARQVEQRIATDAYGAGCVNEPAPAEAVIPR